MTVSGHLDAVGFQLLGFDRADQLWVFREGGEEVRAGLWGLLHADAGHREQQGGVDVALDDGLRAGAAGVCGYGCLLCGGGLAVGSTGLADCEEAGDQGSYQQDGGRGQRGAEAAVDADLLACAVFGGVEFRGGEAFACGEEVDLCRREVRCCVLLPLQGLCEADASVQLTLRTSQRLPRVGDLGEVVEDLLAFQIVLEPAAETRPSPGEGFVSQFDDAVVAGDEARADQQIDERVRLGAGHHRPSRQPAADRLAVRAWSDQAQQERPQHRLLLRCESRVDLLGGLCDSTLDAARRAISGDRQRAAFSTLPSLGQNVGHQRESAWLVGDLTDQQVDQTWFDDQRGEARRFGDRFPKLCLGHAGEQVHAVLHDLGEPRMGGDVGEPIGPEGQDQRRHGGVIGQPGQERLPLGLVLTQREDLLTLIDDQRGQRAFAGQCGGERSHRVNPWRDGHDAPPVAAQDRRDAGPDQ